MRGRRKVKLKYKNPYKSEEELCDVLKLYAREVGYEVYSETNGYDLLLVKDDIQIGIQAKMMANIEVLYQAITSVAVSVKAILVPRSSREFNVIARKLNVLVIEGTKQEYDLNAYDGRNPYEVRSYWAKKITTDLKTIWPGYIIKAKKVWLPEVNIDIPAGVKSPKVITEWKIKAVKLCILLDEKGYLTSADFKAAKVHMGLWTEKWLNRLEEKDGKLYKYVRRVGVELPDQKNPEVVEALKRANNK